MSSAIGNGGVFASLSSGEPPDDDLDLAGLELRVHRLRASGGGRGPRRRRRTRSAGAWPWPSALRRPCRTTTCVTPSRSRTSMNRTAAQVANPMHPAEQHDVGADVVGAQGAAGVRACQVAELLSHVASVPRESRPPAGGLLVGRLRLGRQVLDRDGAGRDFVAAEDAPRTECPRESAYLNCLPILSASGIHQHAQARLGAAAARQRRACGRVASRRRRPPSRRPAPWRAPAGTCRAPPSRRGSARGPARSRRPGLLWPRNMPDQVVVAAAAAEAAGAGRARRSP